MNSEVIFLIQNFLQADKNLGEHCRTTYTGNRKYKTSVTFKCQLTLFT